jgi:pimeloyl-ACP methyl ester carboxylesterase
MATNPAARARRSPHIRKPAPRRRASAGPAAAPPPSSIATTSYQGYRLSDEQVEQALLTGEHAVELETYFGEAAYRELRRLAVEGQTRVKRGGPRVLILPGIMGSKLGVRRTLLDDVIWVDPIDVARGNLRDLVLDGRSSRIQALGVILLAYLKLKLTLKLEGFDADFYPFDWRQEIATSGQALWEHLRRDGRDVYLVAHSMGGLVSRAALRKGLPQVKRLIMLGTPNFGSFSIPQALRGTHSMVRMVAGLDTKHTAEDLVEQVFSGFPGLYQMMPWREKFSRVDLYRASDWPARGPRPRQRLLDGIAGAHRALAEPDDRFVLIAGVNRDTVVDASRQGDDFVYTSSREGDGTVPLAYAQLPGVPTYFVDEDHGSLPNNGTVAGAVVDLLRRPSTDRLPNRWSPPRREARRTLADRDLRVDPFGGRRGTELSGREVRPLLAGFACPPAASEARAGASADGAALPILAERAHFEQVVVGRRRQHRLDVTLAQGSITEASARAYVLGVFSDVDPAGAARAVDERLGGAISEFSARRMLAGGVGETFVIPVGRSSLQADLIIMAGMGSFDGFTPAVQSLVAENVLRLCVRTRVDEFATVVMGAGSGRSVKDSLVNMCGGFLRALADADRDHHFRRIVLCEQNPDRFVELKQALYEMASSPLFADTEVTLDEIQLPTRLLADPEAAERRDRRPGGRDPVYAIVREGAGSNGQVTLEVALLGADSKAAVVREEVQVRRADLDAALAAIEPNRLDFARLPELGARLGELVLPANVRTLLAGMPDRHLVVVHDAPSARIPWETLHLRPTPPPRAGNGVRPAGWAPALGCGLSRRYLAGNLSIAKYLEGRKDDGFLDVLLVTNPTGDLPGAESEGNRLSRALGTGSAVRIREIRGAEATRARLLEEFGAGRYDVIHYAGHAFFDPRAPSQSGIICAGEEPLTGADLTRIGNLPSLVFFNACEAGRIRRGADPRDKAKLTVAARLTRSTGFAEAFLRGGAANYVGTYWPVGDDSALLFAATFYGAILQGSTVAAALLAGRRALHDARHFDWADYIHYGSPDFVIKTARRDRDADPAAPSALDSLG